MLQFGEGGGTPLQYSFAWKIPWTEEPGRLQSMGLLRVQHDWATSLSPFTLMHWRRKWQPTPVLLPEESQGQGEPGGLPSMGLHRARHDWSNLAAAAAAVLFEGMIWSVSSMSSVSFTVFLGGLMPFPSYFSYPQAQHQVTGENSAGIFYSLSLSFKIVVFFLLVMLKSWVSFGFTCH